MKLKITPHTTIKEVQDAFSKVYPALTHIAAIRTKVGVVVEFHFF